MSSQSKVFSAFFPTPKYLLLSAAGLAITDEGVKLLEFKQPLIGAFTLSRHMAYPLPENAIESGFINDAMALKSVLNEIARSGVRYVHATLPEERTYLFTTVIDKVPEENLRDAVAFILEENVPLSLTKAVFDFDIVGEVGKNKLKISVSVLSKPVVDFYVETLTAAGLTPISFDIESQAIARAIVPRADKSPQMIVNFQFRKTGLSVVEDGIVQFTTTLPYLARERLEDFRTEVLKVFTFWINRSSEGGTPKPIAKALLCGPATVDRGFLDQLSQECGAPFLPADRLSNTSINPKSLPRAMGPHAQGYAPAIGAALASSHERLFKLLPDEGRHKAMAEYRRRRATLAVAALSVALLVGVVGSLSSYLLSKQVWVAGVTPSISKGEEAAALTKWLGLEKQKLAALSPKLDQARVSALVADLSSRKPEGISITDLSWRETGNKEGVSLSVAGIAADRQSLLSFESALNISGEYAEVSLPLSSLKKEKDISFQMKLVPKSLTP